VGRRAPHARCKQKLRQPALLQLLRRLYEIPQQGDLVTQCTCRYNDYKLALWHALTEFLDCSPVLILNGYIEPAPTECRLQLGSMLVLLIDEENAPHGLLLLRVGIDCQEFVTRRQRYRFSVFQVVDGFLAMADAEADGFVKR
jgi:hypothetical protein